MWECKMGTEIHINFLAVIISTMMAFIVGFLWYGPLFGKSWLAEMKFTEEERKNTNVFKIFGGAIILNLIISANLAAFLGPKEDLVFGLAAGALAGIGWVAASLGVTYLFGRKSLRLFLIDAGYQAVIYTAMGGILGVWK